jgi:hypothetical protein
MRGTFPITDGYKIVDWQLGDDLGFGFEEKIVNILTGQVRSYIESGARIFPTPRKGPDGGKDLIITSPVDLHAILGKDFYLEGRKEIKIYVECKSSDKTRIAREKILGNISRIKEEKPDYFLLVTNASFDSVC